MSSRPTLNIIGAGKVGRVLCRRFVQYQTCTVLAVTNRSLESAKSASQFIGEGEPVSSLAELPHADIWMVATNDDALDDVAQQLSSHDLRGKIIFHCSGAFTSDIFKNLKGALRASLHPVKSFTGADRDVGTFPGTPCALEGSEPAVNVLREQTEKIGGLPFLIRPEKKLLYHSGLVLVCNYLVALIEAGSRLFDKAGIARADVPSLIKPLMFETLENTLSAGPDTALTGPIARGDVQLVLKQLEAVAHTDLNVLTVYESLAVIALEIAERRGLSPRSVAELRRALCGEP